MRRGNALNPPDVRISTPGSRVIHSRGREQASGIPPFPTSAYHTAHPYGNLPAKTATLPFAQSHIRPVRERMRHHRVHHLWHHRQQIGNKIGKRSATKSATATGNISGNVVLQPPPPSPHAPFPPREGGRGLGLHPSGNISGKVPARFRQDLRQDSGNISGKIPATSPATLPEMCANVVCVAASLVADFMACSAN